MPKNPKADDPMEDVEEEETGEGDATAQLMRNPALLAALQGRLDGIGSAASYVEVRGWMGEVGDA